MTSARWELVRKIFDAALDQPQSAQNDFVRRECREDHELEAEVLNLLAADEQAGSFLERPAVTTISSQTVLNRPDFLAVGSIVCGRFKILRFIGQGGMGQVYEALDLELKGRVALKAIRPDISSDPRVLSRFRREVQLTRRITHPNVCRTFDIERHLSTSDDGTTNDITFLTMELLDGETLADLLRRQGRLAVAEGLPLVLQMVKALGAAHAVGIVHRDFKPSNVLLVPSSNGLRVVVTDFGLARAVLHDGEMSTEQAATSLTGRQELMGTLVYMAPEQFERGEATVASDIYSLGLVMYEMVTGARPFADPVPFAEAAKRIKQPAPSPRLLAPNLDVAWVSTICKCLEVEPDKRFQDVLRVAQELAPERSGSTSQPPSLRNRLKSVQSLGPVSPNRKRSWRKFTVALVLFGLLVSLSFTFWRHYQVRRDTKLSAGATVLLTEIQNGTGDPRFDGTTELIRHQLSQSSYFNLMDRSRIRDVLTQMTKPSSALLDPPTAREVALRSGAPRVIFGAVSRVGDSYGLDVDIEQPDNDPRRSRNQWENHWTWNMSSGASDKEIPNGFLAVVRDASDWIRSEVGESANDIATIDAPPQDVTTDNWAALSEFARAEKFRTAGENDSAIVALKAAVTADPHFALANMRLGDVLVSLSRFSDGYRAYQIALEQGQRHGLTRRERDRLTGIYASDTEDYKTAEAAFSDYTVYYPNDYLGWFYRATPLMMMGRVEEAISSLKKAVEIDPKKMFAPAHIARFNLILGNFDETSKWIQHLRDTGHPDDAALNEGQSNFLQGRYQDALNDFTQLMNSKDPLYRSYGYSLLARLFAEQGQYKSALQALEQGIAADLETGDIVHRADKILDRAYINSKQGHYEASLQDTKLALDLDRSLQRSLTASTILGQSSSEVASGMKIRLQSELRDIESQLPPGDFKPFSDVVRFHLRGEVLLAEGNWKLALQELRKADQQEPPVRDKEYLGRGFVAAAKQITDQAQTARLRDAAIKGYSNLATRSGQVWQWPMAYPPGYQADATFAYVKVVAQFWKADRQSKTSLGEYLKCRMRADVGLREVEEAKRLAATSMLTNTN